jgi:type VI secretion system secreted protein VgrG
MADYKHIIPFIKKAEGGYVNDPDDAGGETNAGVTWKTWQTFFGDTHERFMAMSDEDWGTIFKKGYWDQILGDQIHSQRIADALVDWCYNSGRNTPSIDTQDILIHSFEQHISEDGQFGPATIASINSVDENALYSDIIAKRLWFFDQCVLSHPSNAKFLQGWKNRLSHLVTFESTGHLI